MRVIYSFKTIRKGDEMKDKTKMLTFTALFAVLNFIAFTYGKINIPISVGGTTAIHVANAVVVLSSWLLGPV